MPNRTARADIESLHAALAGEPSLQLVDVRTAAEFRSGHVPGARRLGDLDRSTLDRDRPVWLICRSGARSARAAEQLAAQGFEAIDVDGGTLAWKAAGHPLEGTDGGPNLLLPLLASATLGLAPFQPEPHIVGKLRWIAGGAQGMAGADWFDLAMHGAPWLWLIWALVARIRATARSR